MGPVRWDLCDGTCVMGPVSWVLQVKLSQALQHVTSACASASEDCCTSQLIDSVRRHIGQLSPVTHSASLGWCMYSWTEIYLGGTHTHGQGHCVCGLQTSLRRSRKHLALETGPSSKAAVAQVSPVDSPVNFDQAEAASESEVVRRYAQVCSARLW